MLYINQNMEDMLQRLPFFLEELEDLVFKVVNHTFELILFIYLIPFAWKYLMSAVANGQTSPAMGIPMYFVQAAPLVGFTLSAVRVLQRWIVEFKTVRGKGEE